MLLIMRQTDKQSWIVFYETSILCFIHYLLDHKVHEIQRKTEIVKINLIIIITVKFIYLYKLGEF